MSRLLSLLLLGSLTACAPSSDGSSDAGDAGDAQPAADGGTDAGTVEATEDRFDLQPPTGPAHAWVEALPVSAQSDPAIDARRDLSGLGALGFVVTARAGRTTEGWAHEVALTFRDTTPATNDVARRRASALIRTPDGDFASDTRGLTAGAVTTTRVDGRVVGTFELQLCLDSELAAGHCNGGQTTFTGSFDVARSPDVPGRIDIAARYDSITFDPETDEGEIKYAIVNAGSVLLPAGTRIEVDIDIDDVELEHEIVLLADLLPGEADDRTEAFTFDDGAPDDVSVDVELLSLTDSNPGNDRDRGDYDLPEPVLAVRFDRLQASHGILLFDFTIENSGGKLHFDRTGSTNMLRVGLIPHSDAAPTTATPYASFVGIRPTIPNGGTYSGRGIAYVGPTPSAGTAWMRVDGSSHYAGAVSGSQAWTSTFAGFDDANDEGSVNAFKELGGLPVEHFGQVQRTSYLAFDVVPGAKLQATMAGMNDPTGGANYAAGLGIYSNAARTQLVHRCTNVLGNVYGSCAFAVPAGVAKLFLVINPVAGLDEPHEGTSYWLNIVENRTPALKVEKLEHTRIGAVDDDDDIAAFDISLTVRNDGGAVPADVDIPVPYWFDTGDVDLPEELEDSDGLAWLQGGLASGASKVFTFEIPWDGRHPRRGQVLFAVNALQSARTVNCATTCVDLTAPPAEEDLSDNEAYMVFGYDDFDLELVRGMFGSEYRDQSGQIFRTFGVLLKVTPPGPGRRQVSFGLSTSQPGALNTRYWRYDFEIDLSVEQQWRYFALSPAVPTSGRLWASLRSTWGYGELDEFNNVLGPVDY